MSCENCNQMAKEIDRLKKELSEVYPHSKCMDLEARLERAMRVLSQVRDFVEQAKKHGSQTPLSLALAVIDAEALEEAEGADKKGCSNSYGCTYSRAINQPRPRLCVVCGKPEGGAV